jgi:outer membrane protein
MKALFNITAFVVAACSYTYGQDTTNVTILPFEEAIKIGLEKNVLLNTQKNQLYSSAARRTQAYANYLPGIQANASAQRTDGLQIDPLTGQGANLTSDQFYAQIQAGYVLFNGFNRSNTLKQNNDLFSAQTSFVKRSEQDAVFNITSQYLTVLLDQELLRIAQENLNAQKVVLEQMQGFVDVGSRAAADSYTQNAIVQNFQVSYLRAKITLENDRSLLAQTLQLDPSIPFRVVKPGWDNNNIEFFRSLTLDSLYNIALANREDLKQQNFLVDGAQHNMRANTSGYYPTLSAFVSYGSTYYASNRWEIFNDPSQKPDSFKDQFKDQNPQMAYGLNLTIPIFDRLVTRTNRAVGKVTYENAILTRDNTLKSIKIDVQRTFKNYQTAIESYNASLIQYEAGQLAFQTQEESYRLGIASQVALAQATQTFVVAQASRAQAEVTLLFQQMLLEYALGTLKVEDFTQK